MVRHVSLALAAGGLFIASTAAAQQAPRPDRPRTPGHSWGQPRPHHPGPRVEHRRLQRGFVVNPFWMGPQFHVADWRRYDFPAPPRDHRWIRYYDDAYMVDRGGRVVDTRYGLDWDEYGERWELADGIPHYYGRGDFRPGEAEYAFAEAYGSAHAEGWDYREYAGGDDYGPPPGHDGYGPPMPRGGGYGPPPGHGGYGPPPGHGGYGPPMPRGGGYGPPPGHGGAVGHAVYGGYGYGYPAVIVETTVTYGGMTVVEEVIEEVVETRRAARRTHRPRRARPACNCPAPAPRRAPPAGERG